MELYKAKTNVLKCDFIRGQDQDSISNPDFEEQAEEQNFTNQVIGEV